MIRSNPLSPEQLDKIFSRIESRLPALLEGRERRLNLSMDLAAANASCPLDVDKLLAFPDLDFFHDVCGISNNIDRETGELHHFLPRCAKRQ